MNVCARAFLLAVTLAGVAWLAACGGSSPQTSPSATVPVGDLPPAWVQEEIAWQSLYNGDADPGECLWKLAPASRAAALYGRDTSYLKIYRHGGGDMSYVVVLHGHFTPPDYAGETFKTMYFVMGDDHGGYAASGPVSAPGKLKLLPAMHSYVPHLPVAEGVWGHTMSEGGPFPGGPYALKDVPVAVYAGPEASGQPLTTLRSDSGGFFTIDLDPGVYTFVMTARNHGSPAPSTVTVRAGTPPVAVDVYGVMM